MPTAADEVAAARRPLNSRGWRWTNATASWLARRGVTPNAISLFSIACAAVAACGFVLTRRSTSPWLDALGYGIAIVGIQARLLCNLFDGMVAIEGGHRTPAGELFNETPDRVADTLILVAAGYAADPVYGSTLGWFAALLAMATAYVRVLGKACSAGTYFIGPMAKQQRMAAMTAAAVAGIVLTFFDADRKVLSALLAFVCVGCVPTLFRRLSRIAADMRAKAVT